MPCDRRPIGFLEYEKELVIALTRRQKIEPFFRGRRSAMHGDLTVFGVPDSSTGGIGIILSLNVVLGVCEGESDCLVNGLAEFGGE